MIFKGNKIRLALIAFFLFSCGRLTDSKIDLLLPSSYYLKLDRSEGVGITEIKFYKCEIPANDIDSSILSYPAFSPRNEEMLIGWHHPSREELQDLKEFVRVELSKDVERLIQENYLNDLTLFISYTYDKDEPQLGTKGYNINSWMTLFLLSPHHREVVHIEYGNF